MVGEKEENPEEIGNKKILNLSKEDLRFLRM
jgi:hypothetical protein